MYPENGKLASFCSLAKAACSGMRHTLRNCCGQQQQHNLACRALLNPHLCLGRHSPACFEG